MGKKVIKFDDTEIEEYDFHQHESPISINNINVNKTVVSNKGFFISKILNISLVTKMLEKLDLYAYFVQK